MPKPRYICLGARVLVAAKLTYPHCWKAFILPVAGRCFDEEVAEVYSLGSCIDEQLARFLFPEFASFTYDR